MAVPVSKGSHCKYFLLDQEQEHATTSRIGKRSRRNKVSIKEKSDYRFGGDVGIDNGLENHGHSGVSTESVLDGDVLFELRDYEGVNGGARLLNQLYETVRRVDAHTIF